MKKLLILIFILAGFYTQAQPGFFYPNVTIDEDGTNQDYYDFTTATDTLTISSSGITSPAIKAPDYAGTGGDLAAWSENGTLMRTSIDSALSAVGDVDGPASSTDNAITRFDGTTGKIIQNSSVVIDDEASNATSINMGTSDGSDNKFLSISAGGGATTSRGAYITLSGLEHGQAGVAAFASGTGAAMNISSGANINMSPTAGSRVNITGNLSLGTVTMSTPTNTIGIANGTVPSSSPINAVQLYAEDVSASSELKVRDEAGNITVLSDIGTNFVPYTGAITNVNLGSNNLTTTGSITGGPGSFTTGAFTTISSTSTAAASDNVTLTNTTSGTSARAGLTLVGDGVTGLLSARSDASTFEPGIFQLATSGGDFGINIGNGGTAQYKFSSTRAAFPQTLIGITTARTDFGSANLQVEGTNDATSFVSIGRNSANTNGPELRLFKTRSASTGGVTIANNGDITGNIRFGAADGTTIDGTALIQSYVDGVSGANLGGGFIHYTANSSGTLTETMRINSSQLTTFSGDVLVNESSTGDPILGFAVAAQNFALGIDNSSSDAFEISPSSTLGTTAGIRLYPSGRTSIGENDVLNTGKFYVKGAIDNLYIHVVDGSNNTEWQVTSNGETNSTGGYDVTYRTSGGSESTIYQKTKTINIGDWNMDADITVNVAHGLGTAWVNIRTVDVNIFNDAVTASYSIDAGDVSANVSGLAIKNSTNIVLSRFAGGFFDSADFDATSFNRGYVTITYTTTCTGGAICP